MRSALTEQRRNRQPINVMAAIRCDGQTWRGARRCYRRAPLTTYQPACKPGSVWRAASDARDGHSSCTPVTRRIKQPTRTADPDRSGLSSPASRLRAPRYGGLKPAEARVASVGRVAGTGRAVPIRSCSRWGLPCRFRCRKRGALLPHRFTLAAAKRNAPRRSVLCGTVPGV